jgi:hypothetical protein
VSCGLRTAFGQDETELDQKEKNETPKSDDLPVEAVSGAQEVLWNVKAGSGSQEVSGNLKAASDSQEVSGSLKTDGQRRVELAESEEVGAVDEDEKDEDVEQVRDKPETDPFADRTRSGNLDAYYGKRN